MPRQGGSPNPGDRVYYCADEGQSLPAIVLEALEGSRCLIQLDHPHGPQGVQAAGDDFEARLSAAADNLQVMGAMSTFFADMRKTVERSSDSDANDPLEVPASTLTPAEDDPNLATDVHVGQSADLARPSTVARQPSVRTVIGVPGPWRDANELGTALLAHDVLYGGMVICEIGAKVAIRAELERHNPDMEAAFRSAGPYSSLSDSDYKRIGRHVTCCYLVDTAGGSPEAALRIARLAGALLNAGGLGVNMESTGRAHSSGEWLAFLDREPSSLVDAFVTWVGAQDDGYYCCGMHNLGLPDAMVPADLEPTAAGSLLRSFCYFLVIDSPLLEDDETISLGEEHPQFRLRRRTSQFEATHLFHNPFGIWELRPA